MCEFDVPIVCERAGESLYIKERGLEVDILRRKFVGWQSYSKENVLHLWWDLLVVATDAHTRQLLEFQHEIISLSVPPSLFVCIPGGRMSRTTYIAILPTEDDGDERRIDVPSN